MMQFVIKYRLAGTFCVILFCGEMRAATQNQSSMAEANGSAFAPDVTLESSDPEMLDPVSLPADRLIEDLRGQPEVIAYVKQLAHETEFNQTGRNSSGASQGDQGSELELTDEVLFERIQQDEQFRLQVTQELKVRGYLSESDLPYLANPAPQEQSQFTPEGSGPVHVRRAKPSGRSRCARIKPTGTSSASNPASGSAHVVFCKVSPRPPPQTSPSFRMVPQRRT